jgi:hypothetical protein
MLIIWQDALGSTRGSTAGGLVTIVCNSGERPNEKDGFTCRFPQILSIIGVAKAVLILLNRYNADLK